jgi:tetratricopeptide (TPR) repeat protein
MTRQTILFVAANPLGTDRLALAEEARAIQRELKSGQHNHGFKFLSRRAARPLDLLRALRKHRPTVVHFSGHGQGGARGQRNAGGRPRRDVERPGDGAAGQDGLYFQGSDGRAQFVSAEAVRETFGAAGSSVRVVVLNACYSDAQAEALAAHVDCVVGMDGSILDDTARHFAIGFYGGLGARASVATSYAQGKAAIKLEGDDSARPQLTVRDGIDASRVVLGTDALPMARLVGRSRAAIRSMAVLGLAGAAVTTAAAIAWRVRTEHLRAQADTLRRAARSQLAHLEIEDAEEQLHQAVTLDPDNSLAYADLAVALAERGDYKKARQAAETAAMQLEPLDSRDRAWVLGVAAEMRWNLAGAMNDYTIASALSDDGGFEAKLRLAHVQTLAGRERDARANLDRLAGSAAEDDLRIDYERTKAVATSVAGDENRGALDTLIKRREAYPRIVAVALWKRCSLLDSDGKSDSVAACDRALELFALQRDLLGRARVLSVQATLEAKGLGRFQQLPKADRLREATSVAGQALQIATNLQSQIDRAGALQNRATVSQLRVVLDGNDAAADAGKDRDEAIAIYRDLGDRVSVATLQNNWGAGRLDGWHPAEAVELLREARHAFRAAGADDHAGVAAANLGKAQYTLGDLAGAEASLIEALEIADANQIELYVPGALIDLGSVYLARGQLREADQCLHGVWCYPGAKHREPTNLDGDGDWEASLVSREGNCPAIERALEASTQDCSCIDGSSAPAAGDAGSSDDRAQHNDICARVQLSGAACAFARRDDATGGARARCAIRLAGEVIHRRQEDHRVEITLLATDARARGLLRDFRNARDSVVAACDMAKQYHLFPLWLDVRLAGIELAYRDPRTPLAVCDGDAQALRADAASHGFSLILAKLDALAAAP